MTDDLTRYLTELNDIHPMQDRCNPGKQAEFLAWTIENHPDAFREYQKQSHYSRSKEKLKQAGTDAAVALTVESMARRILYLSPNYRLAVEVTSKRIPQEDFYQHWLDSEQKMLDQEGASELQSPARM